MIENISDYASHHEIFDNVFAQRLKKDYIDSRTLRGIETPPSRISRYRFNKILKNMKKELDRVPPEHAITELDLWLRYLAHEDSLAEIASVKQFADRCISHLNTRQDPMYYQSNSLRNLKKN